MEGRAIVDRLQPAPDRCGAAPGMQRLSLAGDSIALPAGRERTPDPLHALPY